MQTVDIVLTCFVVVISGLFIFSAYWAASHKQRYSGKESIALDYVKAKLGRVDASAIAQGTGITKTPKVITPVQDLLEGLSKETIIADRLTLIGRMRESRVKVSIGALQQMTLAREASQSWLALPSYAASTSMMLGLLGTVVGLSIMLQNMSQFQPVDASQMTMDTWMKSVEGIRGVVGGMKAGFAATVAGLVSAILLSMMNFRMGSAQSEFLNSLDRFTVEELLPATVPATEDESLLEQISLQLETSFTRLEELAGTSQDTLVQLNAIQKGFIDIVDAVRSTTRTEATERAQGLISRLSGVMDQMAGVNQSVITITEGLPKLFKQVESVNAGTFSRIDALINLYEQQRSLLDWPLHLKVVFGFMALLNIALVLYILFR